MIAIETRRPPSSYNSDCTRPDDQAGLTSNISTSKVSALPASG